MDWMNFVQIVAVIFSLFSGKQTEGQELNCHLVFKVLRGTTLKASPGEQLHVNCPVTFCSDSPPTVTWMKMYESQLGWVSRTDQIQTWWRSLTENSGIAVLCFTSISADDAGVYQCQASALRSHYISVTVTDPVTEDHTVRPAVFNTSTSGQQLSATGFNNHSCPSDTHSSALSFHVDVARLVVFAVMTSAVLVLLGIRILRRRGKSYDLTSPPAGGSQTQEGAAESGPADPDANDYEDLVELT